MKIGRDAMKSGENPCFRCRKEAAKYNERLYSRESAAELLGVSVSTLADYELGITKVIPVDKIVLMADAYKSPELKSWYCANECPIGRTLPMLPSGDVTSVERTTLKLLKQLRKEDVEGVKEKLIAIMADGIISEDEKVTVKEILEYVDGLIKAAGELRLMATKAMYGEGIE